LHGVRRADEAKSRQSQVLARRYINEYSGLSDQKSGLLGI
jgi:hypothetical protein